MTGLVEKQQTVVSKQPGLPNNYIKPRSAQRPPSAVEYHTAQSFYAPPLSAREANQSHEEPGANPVQNQHLPA